MIAPVLQVNGSHPHLAVSSSGGPARSARSGHRQVIGFRAFDKNAYPREDDLFDAAMYAVLVSFGGATEARWSRLKRAA
jgi:hypothetical protein